MKVLLCILVSVLFANAGVIHPQLASKLKAMKPGDEIQVIVHMKNRADLKTFSKGAPKQQKLIYLQEFAENNQKAILEYMSGFYDRIDNLRTYWIFNGFTFKANPDIIAAIARRGDVDYVINDFTIKLEPPKPGIKVESKGIEWNIAKVSAPQCWNQGYDGTGIIVGNMDTGVDVTHPALTGKWVPGGWYDAVNGEPEPYDDNKHGTHTMGTICGGDGNGPFVDDIGVAPGAKFICAKMLNYQGGGLASWIHDCFQWFATQDVDVVNNSWGNKNTLITEFWDDCQNWCDLGIYPVFSNGNNGPNPGTASTPGNFPIVTGVGATNDNDDIAGFSSRGPAPDQSPWNNPVNWGRADWNLIKPDISAPGVSVRSSIPGGGYGAYNGTSMAAPHIAGAVAICLQKNPSLDYKTLYNHLLNNADEPSQGTPYPNNDYGWGRLNIYATLQAISVSGVEVTVTTPYGGEIWKAGTTHQITWTITSTQYAKCRIMYSTNSGASYSNIIKDNIAVGVTSDDWTMPYVYSTTARVKVELFNAQGNVIAADENNFDFTIGGPDIVVDPTILGAVLHVGGTTEQILTISNVGTAALDFLINESTTPSQSEDTISYDDGDPGSVGFSPYWAQRFTPAKECKVIGALVMSWASGGACSLYVWDNAGGKPGNLVAGPYVFYGGHSPFWDRIDIPTEYIDENDFWIGNYMAQDDETFQVLDGNSDYNRTYKSDNGIDWTEFSSKGDVLIRAIVDYDVETDIPWLSEAPTQGLINPGANMPITISYDATGLNENTTYYAWLKINSNDLLAPTVVVTDTLRVTPSVATATVTAPNGGEVWEAGTTHPIKWTATGTGFTKCRLKYSTNSGSSYPYTIATNIPAGTTSYNWTLPNINSTTCRVKVELLDASNNIVADDQSDTDFTLKLPSGPKIVVRPLSLGAVLGVGDTTSQFLTIKNIGNAALTFTISESATPPKHGKKKSSKEMKKSIGYYRVPRLAVAPIKDQVLEPGIIPRIEKQSKQGFGYERAIDKGISLLDSEDTIFYDDGTAYWYSPYHRYYAQRFTPAKECKVIGALVMTYTNGPACSLFVWDDVGGEPGNLVAGPYAYTGGHYPDWDRIDIPAEYIDANDFWIGIYADTANGPYSVYDQYYDYGRTYRSNNRIDWSEHPLGELMLRAIVNYEEGTDPVPWLSEAPTQGTIEPGDSMLIQISYDAAGLNENTTYYAWLKINSNDPDNPLVIVPDTLYITPAYAFYDDFDDGNAEGWTINALWHVTSHRSNSPSYSLAYNQESDHTYNTGGRTYGQATFTVDLPSSPVLEFYHCYWTESYNGAYDICRVELLYDGRWHTLKQWDSRDPNVTTWTNVALDLSVFSGTVDIRFYFDSIDRLYNNYEGWYLDNVVVKTIGKCGIAQAPELIAEQGAPRVGDLPRVYSMLQKPNPFSRITTINFALPIKSKVNLAIYNLAGQLIRRLINEEMEPGYYNYHWDGKDELGKKVNVGIYFCKIECGEEFKSVKKVILLK